MSSRFAISLQKTNNTKISLSKPKKFPFKNVYGTVVDNDLFINMEAADEIKSIMRTLRDIGLIIDISGSMRSHYSSMAVQRLCTQIVEALAYADDDGIDLYFFANGLVYSTTVSNASEVEKAIQIAMLSKGAFGTTMPIKAFEKFCNQIKEKQRAGTVLFITDGSMDDGGSALKKFYKNILHTEFKTRDHFYCYAIEFGSGANGALNVLDGLYAPEQGAEDLFDLEHADNIEHIAEVLRQVGGMSAVASSLTMKGSFDNGAYTDMINTTLIPDGYSYFNAYIFQIMSIRVKANSPFNLTISVPGYEQMIVKVVGTQGSDVLIELE